MKKPNFKITDAHYNEVVRIQGEMIGDSRATPSSYSRCLDRINQIAVIYGVINHELYSYVSDRLFTELKAKSATNKS